LQRAERVKEKREDAEEKKLEWPAAESQSSISLSLLLGQVQPSNHGEPEPSERGRMSLAAFTTAKPLGQKPVPCQEKPRRSDVPKTITPDIIKSLQAQSIITPYNVKVLSR
jgi:hypothetical protein